ncbi:hypothetical protein EV1_023674 [Malus domestica]
MVSLYALASRFRRYYQIDTETDNLIYMSPCQGIPEQAEIPPAAQVPAGEQAAYPPVANLPAQAPQPAAPTGGSNANPLDLFPQGLPNMGANAGAGNLDFLRNSPQFQALRAMVQANPQILQPMLQELGKQNPHLMQLIQAHQADFLRLINEPVEGGEGNLLEQLGAAVPQAVTVTPEEREAIERLEAMGFDRALVLEVYFACNKNEELASIPFLCLGWLKFSVSKYWLPYYIQNPSLEKKWMISVFMYSYLTPYDFRDSYSSSCILKTLLQQLL